MKSDDTKDQVSRRGFLGVSSAALVATVGGLSATGAAAQDKQVNARATTDRSATDPGPPFEDNHSIADFDLDALKGHVSRELLLDFAE
jgi:nitrous oxide reductase